MSSKLTKFQSILFENLRKRSTYNNSLQVCISATSISLFNDCFSAVFLWQFFIVCMFSCHFYNSNLIQCSEKLVFLDCSRVSLRSVLDNGGMYLEATAKIIVLHLSIFFHERKVSIWFTVHYSRFRIQRLVQ